MKPISSVAPSRTAHQIGKDAVDASPVGLQLLVLFGGDQQRAGRFRQVLARLQQRRGARIAQIEMQPQPAVARLDNRLIDLQLLRCSIGMEPDGEHQTGQGLRMEERRCARRRDRRLDCICHGGRSR
jgi:hypothetical protein